MKLFILIFVLFNLVGCQTLNEQPTLDRSVNEYKTTKQIVLNDITRLYSQTHSSEMDKKTKGDNRYPYKLTGPKINDHFQRYKNFTFDKGPNRDFTLKIRSFNNIERDCILCGTTTGYGSISIKGAQNQVCFYWDNVQYPSSTCFEVIQIEGNRYQLIDPDDGETYGYTVDGEPFDYTVDVEPFDYPVRDGKLE